MNVMQAMSGEAYTYIKTNTLEQLSVTIDAAQRPDLDTLLGAIETNGSDDWSITDHEGRIWKAKLLITPVQIAMQLLHFTDGQGNPCLEAGSVGLEFIGVLQP